MRKNFLIISIFLVIAACNSSTMQEDPEIEQEIMDHSIEEMPAISMDSLPYQQDIQ